MNKKYPTSWIIAITVFYGLMIVIVFEIFRVGMLPFLFLIPAGLLILYDFTTRMEYNPMHKNPNFLSMDGTISVAESTLEPLHGGRSKITVSTKKDYAPIDKWYRAGGMIGFFSHLAGKIQLDIIDESWKFVQVVGENLGAKEGAYIYLGSLSGKNSYDLNGDLIRKLNESYSLIRTQETVYERAKQLSNQMARSNNLDMLEVQQQFSIILREWGQSFNNPNMKTDLGGRK